MTTTVRSEDPPEYTVELPRRRTVQQEDKIIGMALDILRSRLVGKKHKFEDPASVKEYLLVRTALLEHEEFHVLFLDAQHCLIAEEAMFRGTLSQTSVYPREVVKAALKYNAGAVVFAHNHPSGSPLPSRADEMLTQDLKRALALVDVRVLDHMIVGGMKIVSFAELGML